jgi:hypothetical protein
MVFVSSTMVVMPASIGVLKPPAKSGTLLKVIGYLLFIDSAGFGWWRLPESQTQRSCYSKQVFAL